MVSQACDDGAVLNQHDIGHEFIGSDRRAVAVLRIDIAQPKIRGFEHVHVAVEDFVTVPGHGTPSRRTGAIV